MPFSLRRSCHRRCVVLLLSLPPLSRSLLLPPSTPGTHLSGPHLSSVGSAVRSFSGFFSFCHVSKGIFGLGCRFFCCCYITLTMDNPFRFGSLLTPRAAASPSTESFSTASGGREAIQVSCIALILLMLMINVCALSLTKQRFKSWRKM